MPDLIGYAFDAAAWCENCTFDHFEDLNDDTVDDEGNPIHPIFDNEEVDVPMHCAGCGWFMNAALTPDGVGYVYRAIYSHYMDDTGRPEVLVLWWNEYVDRELFAEWLVIRHPQVVAQMWAAGEELEVFRP